MPILDIYVSVSYSFPGVGVVNAQITYAPGIHGVETMFTYVENVEISFNNAPTSFAHIDDAIAYFADAHTASILADMHTLSNITYDFGKIIRQNPENQPIDDVQDSFQVGFSDQISILTVNLAATTDEVNSHQDRLDDYGGRITAIEGNVVDFTTALAGKSDIGHTHISTDITDSTSLGRSLLTAGFQSDVRAAIGAGTSSFDGAYSSLTGKPTISTIGGSGNYYDASTKPADKSYSNKSSYTFVTTAAAANGDRLSTFRHTHVSYNVKVSSAVQIGVAANVGGYVALEIAATNSTTASDWVEISRVGTGQNVGLALALSSTQTVTGALTGLVPAGYYRRMRTVNENGTPTYSYLSGQEVLEEPLQVAA